MIRTCAEIVPFMQFSIELQWHDAEAKNVCQSNVLAALGCFALEVALPPHTNAMQG